MILFYFQTVTARSRLATPPRPKRRPLSLRKPKLKVRGSPTTSSRPPRRRVSDQKTNGCALHKPELLCFLLVSIGGGAAATGHLGSCNFSCSRQPGRAPGGQAGTAERLSSVMVWHVLQASCVLAGLAVTAVSGRCEVTLGSAVLWKAAACTA